MNKGIAALLVTLSALCLFLFSGWAVAASKQPKTTSKDQVREKVTEALQAIKDFAEKQRQEAVKRAKTAINDLDEAIDRLEDRIDRKWGQMDEAARKKARHTIKSLRKLQNELAEWSGELKHSSGEAWKHVKKGLLESYQTLKQALDQAEKEF